MRTKITVVASLCCLLWLNAYSGADETLNNSELSRPQQDEPFLIRAFGGVLELPQEIYFDSRSVLDGEGARFSNIGIRMLEGVIDFPEFSITVGIGAYSDSTERLLAIADYKVSCYGFSQAVIISRMADDSVVITTVLFDDEIEIIITSDDPDAWINMLRRFSVKHDDPDANCLKGD